MAIPNILPVNNVRLNDHLMDEGYSSDEARAEAKESGSVTDFLPQISHPKLQRMVPTSIPMFVASDKSGPLKWNSVIVGGRMSPVMSCVGSCWPSVREHTVS